MMEVITITLADTGSFRPGDSLTIGKRRVIVASILSAHTMAVRPHAWHDSLRLGLRHFVIRVRRAFWRVIDAIRSE